MTRRGHKGLIMAAATVALSLLASAATADEKADKLAAQKLLTQGNQLAGDGDYLGALDKFKAAHARFPSPKLLLNIGTTLRQLGRNMEAIEVYETYLKDPGRESSREAELKRILGDLNAVIGRIRIEVEDPGATVQLDGKPIDAFKSGMTIRVEPGQHTVVADKKDAPSAVQTITVARGQEKLARLTFAEAKAAPVVVVAPPPSGTQRVVAFVFGGIGVAGIGVGSAFGVLAKVKNDDAKGHCLKGGSACDPSGVELGAAAKRNATISTVAFAVGGGALGTGIILLATAPSQKKQSPNLSGSAIVVAAGPSGGGAFVTVGGVW